MSGSDDISYLGLIELTKKIRARELSATEVLDATVERIEARNPQLNAVVYAGFDEARDAAEQADRAISHGAEPGRLHGVPVLIKDLFDFKPGWPATYGGIPALAGHTTDFHCVFAERAEHAGAIIVGKTNSPVMGFRGTCDNYLYGPTSNPFDVTVNSGGSSGGSAAAVADGFVALAEGTDGGGSIRIPAAWCGVVGFKPGWGVVPTVVRPNGFAGSNPFVAEGPITRSVADAALALGVLAGADRRDPFGFAALDGEIALDSPLPAFRVAYSPDLGTYPVDPRVRDAVESALRGLEEAGATVEHVDISLPYEQRELSDLWCRVIGPLNLSALDDLERNGIPLLDAHRSDLPPEYLRWIDLAAGFTVRDVDRDQRMRTEVYDAVETVFADYDFLVCPTVGAVQVPNATDGNTVGPSSIDGVDVDPLIGWCLTYIANFTGHPAVSLPAGPVEGRLPTGMQVMGHRGRDADLLRLGAAFERCRPWSSLYEIPRQRQP